MIEKNYGEAKVVADRRQADVAFHATASAATFSEMVVTRLFSG
jgi:hypothetical protein